MKFAVRKNHLWGQILYKSPNPVKINDEFLNRTHGTFVILF